MPSPYKHCPTCMCTGSIRVTSVTMTCSACPSQWEGMTDDDRAIYVRYRWGYLSIRLSPGPSTDFMDAVRGSEVFGVNHGDGLDGSLTYRELRKLTAGVIEWPGEKSDAEEETFFSAADLPTRIRLISEAGEPNVAEEEIKKIHAEDERGGGE